MKHLDEKKRGDFDAQLFAPLPGMEAKTQRWTAEQEAEDFIKALNEG